VSGIRRFKAKHNRAAKVLGGMGDCVGEGWQGRAADCQRWEEVQRISVKD
jgi:hypothetical protein